MRTFGAVSKICITYLKQGLAPAILYRNSSEKRVNVQWKPSTSIAPRFLQKRPHLFVVEMEVHRSPNRRLSSVPSKRSSFALAITALWCSDCPVLFYRKRTPSGDCIGDELQCYPVVFIFFPTQQETRQRCEVLRADSFRPQWPKT